jgi:hypothetical protein
MKPGSLLNLILQKTLHLPSINMKKLLLTLKQPYPFYNHTGKLLKNAVVILLAAWLFLFLFSPFSVNKTEHKYNYFLICLIHALNAALVYFLFFLLVNKLFAAFIKEERWKVYKAILITAVLFFLVGLGSFLLRPFIYNNPDNFSLHYFIAETVNTFLVGTLIFAGFTFFDFYRLLKTNQSGASGFGQDIAKHKTNAETKQLITIFVENEPYELNLAEFLFAKAEGNYTEFYFTKNSQPIKQLKRASLKSIEEQIFPLTSTAIRTHRAYFVNTSHILQMTGNAQGYQLYFENIDFPVPVSRALIPAFKLVMKAS